MIKKNWVYILFVCSAIFFCITYVTGKKKAEERNTSLQTFQTPGGWGYDICINNTVYIHQAYIPARPGRKGFATEKEARLIGNLVMSKISRDKLPMVTLSELDSCRIR